MSASFKLLYFPPCCDTGRLESGAASCEDHKASPLGWCSSRIGTSIRATGQLPNQVHGTDLTDYSRRKQSERHDRLANLPEQYQRPIGSSDLSSLTQPIQDLVSGVQHGTTSPSTILYAYGKAAKLAHEKTNCLTEVMLPEAEQWAEHEVNLKGPLAGIPVSLKDTVHVRGFDTSVGFSCNTGKPAIKDGIHVQLLKEAGAVPFVKTNVPISLLSFESTNDVWGRCKNPHNTKYSPGGSSGGEGALIAMGGSRIGIGTDVAGSVRAPAHFSGCYSLRCSTGRWPKMGMTTSMPGQDGIPSVFSPMARTLNDLRYFTKSFISTRPWRLDYSVHPIDWRFEIETEYEEKKRLRIGVLRTDGVVDPAPACARALQETVTALEREGHELFDVDPPSPYEALKYASHLLASDGCKTLSSFYRAGEWDDPGAAQMRFYMNLPRPVKFLWYLWTKYVRQDDVWAGILRKWHPKTAHEYWQLIAQREGYKARWFEWWRTEARMDFLICPNNATPAVPHDAMHDAVSSCGYTFLFNLVCPPMILSSAARLLISHTSLIIRQVLCPSRMLTVYETCFPKTSTSRR